MNRFILWVTVLLFEATDCFMCVIIEINDPSKEVKVRFMKKSGQYFLLSKKLEKWFPKSSIFTGKIYRNHIMKISCFLEKKS